MELLLRRQNNQRLVASATRKIRVDIEKDSVCGTSSWVPSAPDRAGLLRGAMEPGAGRRARLGGYGARLVEKGQFSPAQLTKGPCCG